MDSIEVGDQWYRNTSIFFDLVEDLFFDGRTAVQVPRSVMDVVSSSLHRQVNLRWLPDASSTKGKCPSILSENRESAQK
jgi:hypothetical protein